MTNFRRMTKIRSTDSPVHTANFYRSNFVGMFSCWLCSWVLVSFSFFPSFVSRQSFDKLCWPYLTNKQLCIMYLGLQLGTTENEEIMEVAEAMLFSNACEYLWFLPNIVTCCVFFAILQEHLIFTEHKLQNRSYITRYKFNTAHTHIYKLMFNNVLICLICLCFVKISASHNIGFHWPMKNVSDHVWKIFV